MQSLYARFQIGKCLYCTSLASIRMKLGHFQAQGLARVTAIAVGFVSEQTTATKTQAHQFAVYIGVDQMAGSCHL